MSYQLHPNRITNLELHVLLNSTREISKGVWQPARPISYPSFKKRLKLAYMVFLGKADALIWINQE